MRRERSRTGTFMDRIPFGRENLKNCSHLKKQRIRYLQSRRPRKIWRATRSWIAWSVVTLDTARQRLQSVRRLRRYRRTSRLPILLRPPFLHSRSIIHFRREWRISRYGLICYAVFVRLLSRRNRLRICARDRWTLLWEPIVSSQKMCSLKISAFWSWMRSSVSAWRTRRRSNSWRRTWMCWPWLQLRFRERFIWAWSGYGIWAYSKNHRWIVCRSRLM